MKEILSIAAGGACGAVARFLVGEGARRMWGDHFPWGTLLVNVGGCFLLGLAAEYCTVRREIPPALQRGLMVGFLGALTTFSTFGHETFRRLEQGKWNLAFSNMAANMLLGLFAVWLGICLAQMLWVAETD